MAPAHIRNVIVATNYSFYENIMKPCYPDITSGKSDIELAGELSEAASAVRKLYQRGRAVDTSDIFTSFMEFDISKWCSNMRIEATRPMFTVFEDLMGMPGVFFQIHRWFISSLNFSGDGEFQIYDGAFDPTLTVREYLGGFTMV